MRSALRSASITATPGAPSTSATGTLNSSTRFCEGWISGARAGSGKACPRATTRWVGTGFPKRSCSNKKIERDEIRLGRDDGPFFFSCPERNAARVLRAGAHFTLHGVVFAILCPGLDSKKSHPALARDQAAQRVAEEGNRARGFFWLSGIDDLRCNTPNAEHDQRFMMLQAATTLHQPLIAYQAIFAIAHPRNTAIPEIVFGVRQHSHFRLSAGCMVMRFSQFLTNLESLVAADRFGGKGTSANAGTVPGRNATRRVPAPSTLA